MKKLMSVLVAGIVLTLFSCKKNSDVQTSGSSLQLSATKVTHIGKKEPVTFSVTNPANTVVVWKAVPPKGVWYSQSGNKAFMRFTLPGTYTVYARAGATLDSTVVTIDSTIYTGDTSLPGTNIPMDSSWHSPVDSTHQDSTGTIRHDTTLSLYGDQLAITPSVYVDSVAGDSVTLVLTTATKNAYPNASPQLIDSSYFNYNTTTNSFDLQIDYKGVLLPGGVAAVSNKIVKTERFSVSSDGTYFLVITLNGKTYSAAPAASGAPATSVSDFCATREVAIVTTTSFFGSSSSILSQTMSPTFTLS